MKSGRWGVSFTSEETAPVGEAARKVGGYDELIRLERERRAILRKGGVAQVVRDAEGRYTCRSAPLTAAPAPPPSFLDKVFRCLRGT